MRHFRQTHYLRLTFVALIAIFSISTVLAVPGQQVFAVTKTSQLGTSDMAKSFAAFHWLRSCMNRANYQGANVVPEADANSFNWFFGKTWTGMDANVSTAGVINDIGDKDGDVSCGEAEGDALLKSSAALWGYSTGAELLCDLGFTREVGANCANVAATGNNAFKPPANAATAADNWWKNTMGNSSIGISSIANGGEYALYLQSFLAKCGAPATNGEYTIQTFTAGSTTPTPVKYSAIDRNFTANSSVRVYQENSLTCGQLAERLSKADSPAVLGYVKYLVNNGGEDTGAIDPTCAPNSTDPACAVAVTTCVIEGIGWLVCPVFDFMGGVVDAAYSYVDDLLRVQPLMTTGDTEGAYNAWVIMRTIANVAFVIAFIFIIFAQLTSLGISNYGVKKMLPRLVVAAILVNISFWICAIAVDISNILGSSVLSAFNSIGASIKPPENLTGFDTGSGWGVIVTSVIAGTVAYYVGLSALIPALLAAFVAIVTVFLVLVLRQALLILLIVVAPLAFVAYLLPNTEDWFTKWRKFLMTLLLMYPIIAAIFGASALASQIVMQAAGDNIVVQIMGAAIAIIPLAITPVVMKTAGGVLNRFAGIVNNAERGPIDGLRKVGSKYRDSRNDQRRAKALNGSNQLGRGAFVRWRTRRGAVGEGRKNEANRAATGYIAGQIQKDAGFRSDVAGGGVLLKAPDEAMQRALASSINAEVKLKVDEKSAAGVVIKHAQLDQAELRSLSNGATVEKNGVKLDGTSTAVRSAAISGVVNNSDTYQMSRLWNESKTWQGAAGAELRSDFADSLQNSSSRPAYIGQGAIAQLRSSEGGHPEMFKVVETAIQNNTYSPEKIVTADKDELATVAVVNNTSVNISDADKARFVKNAKTATDDEKLNVRIGKNRENIEIIRDRKTMPPLS